MRFYARKIESRPQGAFVDVIHATWDGQWERLERLHGYIQWLFPVFENAGMNWESSPLTKEGARQIRESAVMSRRVLASYRLMLRFFGFILVDERTGAALTPHPRMASHRSRTPRSPSALARPSLPTRRRGARPGRCRRRAHRQLQQVRATVRVRLGLG